MFNCLINVFSGVKLLSKANPSIAVTLALTLVLLSACEPSRTDTELVKDAQVYLQSNQYQEALIELKNALLKNPQNAEARLLLGQAYLTLGQAPSAQKELELARTHGMSDALVLVPLAESLLMQGEFDQLIFELQPVDGMSDQALAELHTLRGSALLGQNKLAAAEGEFGVATELAPELPAVVVGQARLAAAQGGIEAARTLLVDLVAREPGFAEAWSLLGILELGAGNAADAERAFTESIALRAYLGTDNLDIARRANALIQLDKYEEALTDLERLRAGGLKQDAYVAYLYGLVQFHGGNYVQALEAFQASHDVNPSFILAEYYLAVTHYLAGNLEQAKSLADLLKIKIPQSTDRLLGAIYIGLADFDAAEKALSEALGRSPNDTHILKLLAEALWLKGEAAQSAEYYQRLLALEPDSAEVASRVVLAKLMAGQSIDEELPDAGKDATSGGFDPFSRKLVLALSAFRQGDLELALQLAESLHREYPGDTRPLNLMAAVYLSTGRPDEARDALEKALEIDPAEVSALTNLARLEATSNKLEQSLALLKTLLSANPQDEQGILLLAAVETRRAGEQAGITVLETKVREVPDSAALRLALADRYFRSGNITGVVEITENLNDRQFTAQPGLLELRGRAQELSGNLVFAQRTFEKWAQLAPESAPAHYQFANSLTKSGDKERARGELERAIQLDPRYLPARIGEIKMQVHDGKVELAGETLQTLMQDFGDHPEVMGIGGWYALGMGDLATAEKRLSMAMQNQPSGELALLLFSAHWRQQQFEQAITVLREWLNQHPEDLAAQMELAKAYELRDQPAETVAAYRRILEIAPANVEALNNLAWLLKAQDSKQAVGYAKTAYELAPKNPLVMDTYGVLLVERGNVSEGLVMIQRAAELSPADSTIQVHLGEALIENGMFAEAQAVLDRLAQMDVDPASAKAVDAMQKAIASGMKGG